MSELTGELKKIAESLQNNRNDKRNPLEECEALKQLLNSGMSQAEIAKALNHSRDWVAIRLTLRKASDEIKQFVHDGVIKDCRTLYDLHLFEKTHSHSAHNLIRKIRNNEISGPYRVAIANAKSGFTCKPRKQLVLRARQKGNSLTLHIVGRKSPFIFDIPKEAWS